MNEKKRKVLIVDDMEANRTMLKAILCQRYIVLEARDGLEAINMLRNDGEAVSAVLLDIVMPEMDGFDVLRAMRSDAVMSHIPVIMMTGSMDEEARVQALGLGANDFVMKPYNADIIMHCLVNNIALHETVAEVNYLKRDRLTGLYSRETFFEEAEKMIYEKEPGYYIMAAFDIDGFKIINDQYGLEKGDEVLKYIANIFKVGFEKAEGLCCRISADNFAVIYPVSFSNSDEIAKMRRQACNISGISSSITFSIGRYIIDDLSLSASAMYDRATLAAETVKGRYDESIAFYNDSMRDHLIIEQEIVTEMEFALKNNQFEAWYQPQYNHSSGALVGSEALARWNHPIKGLIPPGKFIPVFEKNGFVYELDKYIWEDVCRNLRKWINEGRNPLPVSVNISRYDIFRTDLVDVITGLMKKYELPVDMLRLEITESAFSKSASQIIAIVRKLIDFGFTVEIDDFGSGYSSLNTLKDVPAQVLKLDMKFLESSENSQRGGNIVESIVRMAKWLGMAVIAEGVETLSQADFLKSIGCGYIQGYLYSKPVPVGEFETLCKNMGKEERLLVLETVENLDNNSFWDPASMDTLIFNSYVGAACIYEYDKGQIELIRATDKYAQVICNSEMTVEDVLKLNLSEYIDDDSARRVGEDLITSIETKSEITGEYVFLDLPGCPHETYLRTSMRVIATAGDRYLVYCTNENITAQRESELREHLLAEEMRLIMANVNGGICAAEYLDDGDVRIIFANDNFYSMYGYTKEQYELELSSPLDPILPVDREKTMNVVKQLVSNGGSATYEYRCKKRDGSVINVFCNNTFTSFKGVSNAVLLSVTTDTTELLRAQRRERRSSQQLQAILENMNGGFSAITIDKDGKGTVVFANEKYYQMFGYTREQMKEEIDFASQVIHPDERGKIRRTILKCYEERISCELKYRCVKRDGTVIYVRGSKSIAHIDGYDDDILISIVSDITELVNSELQAKKMSEQMQAIMDNVDQGITATIVDKTKTRFLFANNRYYELLGYTKEQYENEVNDPFMTIAEDDRERARHNSVTVSEVGKSNINEYKIIKRDGSIRDFRIAISVCRFADVEDIVQLAIFRDITEVKQAEATRMRLSEQLNAIMNDINSGITAAIINERQKIELLFSNDRYFEIHGYTREQYNDEVDDAYLLIHPDDIEEVCKRTKDAYANEIPIQIEYRIIQRDKEIRWINVCISSTYFTGYEKKVCICCFNDITERKQNENKAKETATLLQHVLNDMPGGFVRLKINPDGSRIPVYINSGFNKLVGMNNDELREAYRFGLSSGIHPDDIAAFNDAVEYAKREKGSKSATYRIRHKSGEYIRVSVFGRITTDVAGNKFLNVYYTDAGTI